MERSKKNIVKKAAAILAILVGGLTSGQYASAQTTWDGGGGDLNWTTGANWDDDLGPAFDGTENITFATGFASGLATQLNGNKAIDTLTVNTLTDFSINGNVLTINSGINRVVAVAPAINSDILLGGDNTWNGIGSDQLQLNGDIDDGANDFTITLDSGRYDFNGAKSWSGGIIIDGTISDTLTYLDNNANFGTGKITIIGGRILGNVTFANDAAFGPNAIHMDNNVTINGNVDPLANDLNFNANLTLADGLTEVGGPHTILIDGRRLQLNGNNSLTGDFQMSGIGARLTLGGTDNSAMSSDIHFDNGIIDFNAAATKPAGTGTIYLNAANDGRIGGLTPAGGTLDNPLVYQGGKLGSTNNLTLTGPIDPIQDDLQFVAGGSVTMTQNIQEVGGARGINVANVTTTLTGNLGLTGDVTVTGGSLILQGANSFAGKITLDGAGAYLRPDTNTALGTAKVVYNQGNLLPFGGSPVMANELAIHTTSYNFGGMDHTFTGLVRMFNSFSFDRVSGVGDVLLLGDMVEMSPGLTVNIIDGEVWLGGDNNFSGDITVQAGARLNLGSDTAAGLGTINVNAGADRLTAFGGPVDLANNVIWNKGNWENSSNQLSVGSVTISSDLDMLNWNVTDIVEFKGGIIEASAGLNASLSGDGTVIIGPGSTYTGNYTGSGNSITIVEGNAALGNTASQSVFASGAVLAFRDNVNYTDAKPVSVIFTGDGDGAIQSLGGDNAFAGPIEFRNNVTIGVSADSLTLSGDITETSASTLTKVGSGLLIYNGTAGNTGGVAVNDGDLQIGGSVGNVTLAAGTSLTVVGAGTTGDVVANDALVTVNNTSGTGTGNVTANGTTSVFGNGDIGGNLALNGTSSVNPGNSAGVISIAGDLTFASFNNNYNLEILAQTIGYAHDQIIVGGDVDLNSAFLNVTLTTPVEKWQKLFIVINNGGNAVGDEFIGLVQGQLFDMGGGNFARISYFGDSGSGEVTGGNDIVLYDFSTSIPEPATLTLLSLGGLLLGRRRKHRKA